MERRPKFKQIHPVIEMEPGLIRLGELFGTAIELEDPDGSIRQLIKLMDGTRTVEQIYKDLSVDYVNLTMQDVIEGVEGLNEYGFLYDQAIEDASHLNDKQRMRYKANLGYFSFFANLEQSPGVYQERLRNATVTVLGMGAFGSSILVNLAGLGVGKIRIADFDTVELSNLNRQILFNENDLDRFKIDVAEEFIKRFNSEVQVEKVYLEIKSAEDAERAIEGSDLVLLAADQPFFIVQRWVNKACTKLGIPFIGGGINLTEGQMFTILPGQSGCIDCMHLSRIRLAEDYPQILARQLETNFIPPTATTAPNVLMITGMIAAEATKFLTGIAPMESVGKVILHDFMTFEKSIFNEWERDEENCPSCGAGSEDQPIFQVLLNKEFSDRNVVPRG
jgi:molybdopterin-synthase adenylyltransferase